MPRRPPPGAFCADKSRFFADKLGRATLLMGLAA